MKINFSGRLYEVAAYGVDPQTFRVDMDVVRAKALEHRPKLIIAGWSAYPRQLDFAAFRQIADEVGAYLMVDMAHFAGLVAAGLHPSPVPHAHVTTSTTHKTLAGPRGGIILSGADGAREEVRLGGVPRPAGRPADARHRRQGGGVQGRRDAGVRRAAGAHPARREDPGRAAARRRRPRRPGCRCSPAAPTSTWCWSTCASRALDGQQAEDRLHEVGITVNRNAVPFDPRPPMVTSGLRIGTPALATRGFGDEQFAEVADVIAAALQPTCDVEALRGPGRPSWPATSRCTTAWSPGDRPGCSTARPPRPRSRPSSPAGWPRWPLGASSPGWARCWSATTRAASAYVAGKHRDCAEVGIASIRVDLPADRDPGRGGGRRPAAQRRPGLHRLHRAAAAARRAWTPTGCWS